MKYDSPLLLTYKKNRIRTWKADTGPSSAMEADTDLKTESESRIMQNCVVAYMFFNVSTLETYGVDIEPYK